MTESRAEAGQRVSLRMWLRNAAGHRLFPLAVMVLGMVLVLPSLSAGLLVDDYHHRLLMKGSDSPVRLLKSPLDMFRFFDGDPERARQLKDMGVAPWWATDNAKAAFWRPISSLTHWLDYTLWPDSVPMMHAQSVLWYGLLVLCTALLYRRFAATATIAAVAALLFAFDDTHATPVGFLANRNAVIAATFGVLALLAHDRYRRGNSRPARIWAVVLLATSLLSAEAGIATAAYLASYALFLDRDTWKGRLASMVPYVAVIVVWRLLWNGLGYGVENFGVYIDPVREPLRYAGALKDRGATLLLGQLLGPPSDVTMVLTPSGVRVLWCVAVGFLAVFGLLLIPSLRRERVTRFWAVGMLLSVLPICATFPSDRLLVFTSIGAMGLIAQFLAAAFGSGVRSLGPKPWRFSAVALASLFVLVHGVVAGPVLLVRSGQPMGPKSFMEQMLIGPLDRKVETQDLIVVNPPLAFLTSSSALIWADEGTPFPRSFRLLSSSLFEPVEVRRPDAKTLIVRPRFGYYAWVLDALFRDPKATFRKGDRVELSGMTVEVLDTTSQGRALEAAFIFPVPLEDPSLRWMQHGPDGLVPFTPPPVGESVTLAAPNLPWRR